ncbi:MAG TPA: DUF4349 domain-containing protein [Candidatus Dormibacteraeota bacterium]|nr:DUF4349 domain-containing protein [Candidatus Dormibacteraeota bacterium]
MKKLFAVLGVLIAVAACGGQSASEGVPMPAQIKGQTGGGGTGQSTTPGGGSTSTGGQISNIVPVLNGPPVIRQAQLGIQVGAGMFDSRLSQVRTIVEADGGYIAGTDAQAASNSPNDSSIRTGTLNFMIPAANFDSAIDEIAKVGTLRSEHITGTDVSAQYVDLNARLANAEAQRDAMLALLKQATNINDIIAIQNQIGQITSQIEQLKGQIKYLDQYTAYSTVTVTLTEAAAPAQSSSDSWGFATALNDSAHNFVATINYFVAGIGVVGPFLVLVVLGYIVWRRRRPAVPRPA